MLFDVLLQTAEGKDDRITEILIVVSRQVTDQDPFQIGQECLDPILFHLGSRCVGDGQRKTLQLLAQGEATGKPDRVILLDTRHQLGLERMEELADEGQGGIVRCTLLDERLQVTLDVRQLVTGIIEIGLCQIVDDL